MSFKKTEITEILTSDSDELLSVQEISCSQRSSVSSIPWAEDAVNQNKEEWDRLEKMFRGELDLPMNLELRKEIEDWQKAFPSTEIRLNNNNSLTYNKKFITKEKINNVKSGNRVKSVCYQPPPKNISYNNSFKINSAKELTRDTSENNKRNMLKLNKTKNILQPSVHTFTGRSLLLNKSKENSTVLNIKLPKIEINKTIPVKENEINICYKDKKLQTEFICLPPLMKTLNIKTKYPSYSPSTILNSKLHCKSISRTVQTLNNN